jgi:hypothetical protein
MALANYELKFELIKQELILLQGIIQKQSDITFKIKGWAITIFSAFSFFAADKQKPAFIIISTFAVVMFWLFDSMFKHIQSIFIARSAKIQRFLQNHDLTEALSKKPTDSIIFPNIAEGLDIRLSQKVLGILRKAIEFHNAFVYYIMIIVNIYFYCSIAVS